MTEANPRARIGGNAPPTTAELMKQKYADHLAKVRKWLARAKPMSATAPKTLEECAKLEALFAEGRDLANDADRLRVKEKEEPLRLCTEIDGFFGAEFRDKIGADPKKGGLARQLADAAATRRLEITRAEQRKQDEQAEKMRAEAERLRLQAEAQDGRGKTREADVTFAKAEGAERAAEQLEAQAAAPLTEATRSRHAGGGSVSVNAILVCTGVVRAEIDLEALRPYFKQEDIVAAVTNALKLKAFTTLKGAAIIEKAKSNIR